MGYPSKKETETKNPKILDEKINSGKIGGIYCLFGEEEYMIDYYIGKLSGGLAKGGEGGFDYAVFDPDNFDIELFSDTIPSYPVLSDYKFAVVKNADTIKFKSGEKEKLLDLLSDYKKDIAEYACVIFKMKNLAEPAQDKTEKIAGKKSGPNLTGFLKENADLFEFKINPPSSLVKWIIKIAASEQTEISEENAGYILERCEPLMYPLKSELDKLIRYSKAENRSVIQKEDIDLFVSKKIEMEAFELTNAILEKKYGKAIESLDKLKNLKEEPIAISGQIAKYFCDLLAAYMAASSGSFDYSSISKKTGIHEYKIKLALGSLKRYAEPARFIDSSLNFCRECDKKLKSTSLDDFGLLKNLLCDIARL
jgi:DNA polymerase-3 subunit delta